MFEIPFKRIKAFRKETLLLILVIGVPVFILTNMVFISKGLNKEIEEFMQNSKLQLTVRKAGTLTSLNYKGTALTIQESGDKFFDTNRIKLPKIQTNIEQQNVMSGSIIYKGEKINVTGMDLYRNNEGSRPLNGEQSVLVGGIAADNLDLSEGDSLEIGGIIFEDVSILKENHKFSNSIIMPLKAAQKLMDKGSEVSEINLFVPYKYYLEGKLNPLINNIENSLPEGIKLSYIKDAKMQRLDFINSINGIYNIFTIITLVSVTVIIFNYLLNNIKIRSQEVGIMQAMGIRLTKIAGMIFFENTLLIFFATLGGFLLSILSSMFISQHLIGNDFYFYPYSINIWILMFGLSAVSVLLQAAWWYKTDPMKLIKNA